MSAWFSRFATTASTVAGHWLAFLAAFALVMAWIVGGFFVGFSDPVYQLYINTGTTIITFLMVFLIQNTQNRSDAALHIKEDALIRATPGADNRLIPIEHATEEELRAALKKFERETEKVEEAT